MRTKSRSEFPRKRRSDSHAPRRRILTPSWRSVVTRRGPEAATHRSSERGLALNLGVSRRAGIAERVELSMDPFNARTVSLGSEHQGTGVTGTPGSMKPLSTLRPVRQKLGGAGFRGSLQCTLPPTSTLRGRPQHPDTRASAGATKTPAGLGRHSPPECTRVVSTPIRRWCALTARDGAAILFADRVKRRAVGPCWAGFEPIVAELLNTGWRAVSLRQEELPSSLTGA